MKPKHFLFYFVFTFCAGACITVYAQAVNKQDSLALVDLYNSTNGPNWYDHTNWLTKKAVKSWSGITVTGTRVTYVGLEDNNLSGQLPASLGNLVNLQTLELDFNGLNGSIPTSLGTLKNLTGLNLERNQLSGNIPSSIGNLVNLQYFLQLDHNQLSGSIPS